MKRLAIVGGGAAGMFCAARLAAKKNLEITVFESSHTPLGKVLASGGGRCNFTNAQIDSKDPRDFYPRGGAKLRKILAKFSAADTVNFFKKLGVKAKIEDYGRIFPASDSSADIANALGNAAQNARIFSSCKVESILKNVMGEFEISYAEGATNCLWQKIFRSDFVLLATGGRWGELQKSVEKFGHVFLPPVPSLYALEFDSEKNPECANLSGISFDDVILSIPADGFANGGMQKNAAAHATLKNRGKTETARGAFIFTHFGASGPAVLELTSRAAKRLFESDFCAEISADFAPNLTADEIYKLIDSVKKAFAASKIKNAKIADFPQSAWLNLFLRNAKIDAEKTWANLTKTDAQNLCETIKKSRFNAVGRAPNKGEFVTCGGVDLGGVNLDTMESTYCPNLFFAGECLDIDAITGGFNLQSAWSTAELVSRAIETRI